MTTQAKRKTSWWVGTLILLGLPAAAVAALAVYVFIVNARPQQDPLHVRVQPQVVFPWQEAHFLATVTGEPKPEAAKPPETLDIAFLVDVSGSMTESIPTMANAAREMARELAVAKGDQVRFALVRFDVDADIVVPWTSDVAELGRGLDTLNAPGANNDPREVFKRIDELASTVRKGKRAMVFYTDGYISTECPYRFFCRDEAMSYSEAADAAEPVREAGIDLFCVGRPGGNVHPVMLEITGSSGRIFLPTDVRDLASNFSALSDAVSTRTHAGTSIAHPLDGRHFRVPLEGTAWVREPGGTLRLDIGRLPRTPTTFGHPLVPLHAGLWRVGAESLRLTYAGANGRVVEARADTRPRMLVLTWAVLLLPLLPWLVWLLFRSVSVRPPAVVEPPALPVRTPPLPTALPPLPRPESSAPPLPTLFVGIGGAGRESLHAIRADLEQLHLGGGMDAYRFLALDLDQREPEPSKFASAWAAPIESVMPPRDIVQLRDFVPRPGEVPAHLSWFDAVRYEHAAREELNLADGSKGDRTLSRLALFRWLAVPESPLVEKLRGEIDALSNAAAGVKQIVVVASAAGGVGSGWFTDVMRVLRRLLRARQRGSEVLPEIAGVLVATQDSGDPTAMGNRAALIGELESIALTGRFPRRVAMVPDDEILDRTDTECPFDWLMEVADVDASSAAAQSGALAALLCQKNVRRDLLRDVAQQQRVPAVVATNGIHILATLMRDRVQSDLLLRLLGPDVLLDIQPVRGGYAVRKLSESEVQQALDEWIAEEPPRTPVRQLLSGAEISDDESMVQALCTSVNRRLRGWRPVLAAETLRTLANRLGDSSPSGRVAASIAEALDRWVRDLAAFAANADRQRSFAGRLAFARTLNRRRYLDADIDSKAIEEASRTALERWLGTKDTLAPLRERLFFTIEPNDAVVLRSHVATPVVLATPAEGAEAFQELARALAASVPALRLADAIARLDDDGRDQLARTILDSDVRPDSVIVAAPADLEEFRRSIGQPAADGVRRDCVAADVSSIRRTAVASLSLRMVTAADPPYVETAERESDRIRFRIGERYSIRVPPLPPELRIAAAHPSRFRSFADAYETGGIVRRQDESGVPRWYAVDRREFLGLDDRNALAHVAASYVYSEPVPATARTASADADFSALDEGIARGGDLNEEGLVLAAIRVTAES
jgi:Tubulin like/von Willebrand factor type A domain